MFGVWCLVFGVWYLGSVVWGLGFGVWGLGFGVWGFGFWVDLSGLALRQLLLDSVRVLIVHLQHQIALFTSFMCTGARRNPATCGTNQGG